MAKAVITVRVTQGTYDRIEELKKEKGGTQMDIIEGMLANAQGTEEIERLKKENERLKKENENLAEEASQWQHKAVQKL